MIPKFLLIKIVQALNNAQLGSLGEFLAVSYYTDKKAQITPLHRMERDFRIEQDGEVKGVDIKTHRFLTKRFTSERIRPYYGKRIENVFYEQVFIFSDKAVFVADFKNRNRSPQVLANWSWHELAKLVFSWSKGKTRVQSAGKDVVREQIKDEIKNWFTKESDINKSARIIIRGQNSIEGFGMTDLPDNMPGTKTSIDRHAATIFVQMVTNGDGQENVEFVIAYPHDQLRKLPRTKASVRQQKKGITEVLDLPRILYSLRRKYHFRDLDELMSDYFERFA